MSFEPPGGAPPPPPPAWPPGAPYPATSYSYPAHSHSHTPAGQVSSLKGLSTATMILLAISGVAAMVALAAFLHRATVVDDLGVATFRDVRDADDRVRGGVALFQLSLAATGVLWIIWQFRHAKNAQVIRGNYGLGPAWAIAGWLIPVANLVLGELQLWQSAKASDPDLPPGQPASAGTVPGVMPVWWAAYDAAVVLMTVGAVVRPNLNEFDADVDRFMQADRISALAMLLYALAAVFAIATVRALTTRQVRALAVAGSASPQGYGQTWQPTPPSPTPPPSPQWPTPPPSSPAPPQWPPPPPSPSPPQWPPP